MSLDALLRPRNIAILGASENSFVARSIMGSLKTLGFTGGIYPVNPKYESVHGIACFSSLRDLPEPPDAVAFCVSGARVLENIEIAAECGAGAAVVYDGGFAERGDEGEALQRAINDVCRSASIKLCGPNCMGIVNPHEQSSIYMQEVRDPANLAGNVGLISQSGSICIGMLADVRRFGFSHVISSGNEAVVCAAEYLEALIDDPKTKVVALFLESVRNPQRFVAALDRAAAVGKPVVVLKVGRSERVQRAITSHTGGLAGSSRVFSEVLRAHRAIEASDMDEFTEIIAACQGERWPTGNRIAVVTFSGGQAELVLDIATEAGLNLPALSPGAREEVEKVVGHISGDGNPLDAWGGGDPQTNLLHALKVLDSNNDFDVVVLCSDAADNQPMGRPDRILDYLKPLALHAKTARRPHYTLGTRPGVMATEQVNFLKENGLMHLGGARQGLGALDRLARWSSTATTTRRGASLHGEGIREALSARPERKTVNEFDAKSLLAQEGLPVTREALVTTLDAARRAAEDIGYPVVLKIVSDQIAHKSDLGLVLVNLKTPNDLASGWQLLGERAEATGVASMVEGFLVQEMVAGGIEVFAGLNRDPDFGLVLAFGMGGVAVEILKDVSLRLLPLRVGDAAAMVNEIKGSALLHGARHSEPFDVPALTRCLEIFADYAWADRDNIAEIDLNPIKVLPAGKGCRIVDALIVPRANGD